MQRNSEIRIRVTAEEKQMIELFIKSGKDQKLWKNNRTALNALIDYWSINHTKGKFY